MGARTGRRVEHALRLVGSRPRACRGRSRWAAGPAREQAAYTAASVRLSASAVRSASRLQVNNAVIGAPPGARFIGRGAARARSMSTRCVRYALGPNIARRRRQRSPADRAPRPAVRTSMPVPPGRSYRHLRGPHARRCRQTPRSMHYVASNHRRLLASLRAGRSPIRRTRAGGVLAPRRERVRRSTRRSIEPGRGRRSRRASPHDRVVRPADRTRSNRTSVGEVRHIVALAVCAGADARPGSVERSRTRAVDLPRGVDDGHARQSTTRSSTTSRGSRPVEQRALVSRAVVNCCWGSAPSVVARRACARPGSSRTSDARDRSMDAGSRLAIARRAPERLLHDAPDREPSDSRAVATWDVRRSDDRRSPPVTIPVATGFGIDGVVAGLVAGGALRLDRWTHDRAPAAPRRGQRRRARRRSH